MSKKPVKLKSSVTATPLPVQYQSRYRWSFEYADGKVMDKYNDDGTKNVYAGRIGKSVKVHVPLQDVKTAALTDVNGNVVVVMDVPEGAVVFQRRRVRDINYYNKFHLVTKTVPATVLDGRYVAERQVTKTYPEYTYSEVWLLGYRKREPDDTIRVQFKAVYPDGKVEEYSQWNVKPWLKEPEWFSEEQV
jgi:hypothetical protein